MPYVTFKLPTRVDTPNIIHHINGCVLTRDQLNTIRMYRSTAWTTFTVRCDSFTDLLKQFTDEGFELEDDFESITLTREPA